MIDVSGDIIYFDNRPVGFITIPNGTMRSRFMEALESVGDAAEWKIDEAVSYIENTDHVSMDKILEILS